MGWRFASRPFWVPPPTRGWSLRVSDREVRRTGSPAHAGMVPCPSGQNGPPYRFPRPRGDGPTRSPQNEQLYWVPPPTRGWSRGIAIQIDSVLGSPAHAGMVPHRRKPASPACGFPRPRGDGPCRRLFRRRRKRVPPPTRGWSQSPLSPPSYTIGFPRPRGDGPSTPPASRRSPQVPPPTRGWSPDCPPYHPRCAGSPAHAGMVPTAGTLSLIARRFPRPRGDGPLSFAPRPGSVLVPPPTRGWSHSGTTLRIQCNGSPAHAGMVPERDCPRRLHHRFPRPRGDGPPRITSVFPASMVPPPTRGWSPDVGRVAHGVPGSPAHAGMVPT